MGVAHELAKTDEIGSLEGAGSGLHAGYFRDDVAGTLRQRGRHPARDGAQVGVRDIAQRAECQPGEERSQRSAYRQGGRSARRKSGSAPGIAASASRLGAPPGVAAISFAV